MRRNRRDIPPRGNLKVQMPTPPPGTGVTQCIDTLTRFAMQQYIRFRKPELETRARRMMLGEKGKSGFICSFVGFICV